MITGVVGNGGENDPAIGIIVCPTGGGERDLCFSTGDRSAAEQAIDARQSLEAALPDVA